MLIPLFLSFLLPVLGISLVKSVAPRTIRITDCRTGLNSTTLGNTSEQLPPSGIPFAVNVTLSGLTSDLAGWQVGMTFDNNSLKCMNILIPESDPSYVFHGISEIQVVDFSESSQNATYTQYPQVTASAALLDPSNAVTTSNALLCVMNFTAFKAGQKVISFYPSSPISPDTFLTDSNNFEIPFESQTFSVNILEKQAETKVQINFSQTGLNPDYPGTVVIIDGNNYTIAGLPASFMWTVGSSHSFAYQSPLIVAANAKRYVWNSTTGPVPVQSGNINATSPQTITGNYKTQYYLAVSSSYDSPSPTSNWFDENTNITASVTSVISGPTGTRHVCTGWTGTGNVPSTGTDLSVAFVITQPSNITWNWKTQYLLTISTTPIDLDPQPSRIPTGEVASVNSWWYDFSTSVTLTAGAVENYTFNFWSVDDVSQGDRVNPISATMNAPRTVIAHYTSNNSVPDIVIRNLTTSKTVVGQGYTATINVTVENQGANTESFNVTVYAGTIVLASQTLVVDGGNSIAISVMWNTSGVGMGNHTLRVYAEPVPGETDISNNNYTCSVPVHVGVPGDISGPTPGVYDGKCDMRDISYLIIRFNSKSGLAKWNPNADINDDGVVNMRDISIAVLNFNKHE